MQGSEQIAANDAGAKSLSFRSIDHIALAVHDLEKEIAFFKDVLGFNLNNRREVKGRLTGMISAEMEKNGIRFVLCQGTEPDSQVSRLVSECGGGVAHIALAVDDVESATLELKQRGLSFDTDVINGPGLSQVFSSRYRSIGMSFELINRDPGVEGFDQNNVQKLFDELERKGSY